MRWQRIIPTISIFYVHFCPVSKRPLAQGWRLIQHGCRLKKGCVAIIMVSVSKGSLEQAAVLLNHLATDNCQCQITDQQRETLLFAASSCRALAAIQGQNHNLSDALLGLEKAAYAKRSNTALLSQVHFQIEDLLRSGFRREEILAVLNDNGISLKLRGFDSALRSLRRKAKAKSNPGSRTNGSSPTHRSNSIQPAARHITSHNRSKAADTIANKYEPSPIKQLLGLSKASKAEPK